MFSIYLRMARRFVRYGTGRLALTIVALTLGVALVCAIDLVDRSLLRAFTEVIDTMAGRAALQVTAGHGGPFSEDVAATVATVPGVELAVPVVSASAFTTDERGEMLTIQGVDITNEAMVRVYEARDRGGLEIEDPLVFLNQADSIVLTRSFAARHGLAVGSTLDLTTPTGRRTFTVRGLLEPRGIAKVYDGALVVMDIMAAEAAFVRPGFINRVDVVVRHDADVERVASDIRGAVPAGLSVEAPAQRQADLQKIMQAMQYLLQAVALIALVGAFLICFNRLATVFETYTWQLGIMRAVGIRPRRVWHVLITQGLLVGAAGVLLGIPLGMTIGRLLLPVVSATMAVAYQLLAPETAMSVHPLSLVAAIVVGLLAALLAACLPAWRVTGKSISLIIGDRGVEQVRSGPMALLLLLIVVGCIAMLLAVQRVTHSAVWGVVASGLIGVAVALAARPLLHVVSDSLRPTLAWLAGPSGRLAAGALLTNPRRVALTAGTLAVGIGVVVWLGIIAQSFEQTVIDTLTLAQRSDLRITSSHIATGLVEAPLDSQVVDEIKAIPGVEAVATMRMTTWEYGGGPIALHMFDQQYFSNPRFGEQPLLGKQLPDAIERIARGDAFLASSNFLLNLGVAVGDTITIDTPRGPLRRPIAASASNLLSPRGTLMMSRELYEAYWNDSQVTQCLVLVHSDNREGEAPAEPFRLSSAAPRESFDGAQDRRRPPDFAANVAAVRAAIERTLGVKYGLFVLSSQQSIQYYVDQIRRAFFALHILTALIFVVVLLGTADTLAAGVIERTRELGTIRALGVRRRSLARMIQLEALVIGTLGVVLALAGGTALGRVWIDATFAYLLGWVIDLHTPYAQAIGVTLVTMAVCLGAAALPARRAARIEPAIALRYE